MNPAQRLALFAYESQADLNLQTLATRQETSGITIQDVTFEARGQAVNGSLVIPPGAGKFPAVLWVHWLGEPETTNRTEFLGEAVRLAEEGVVSLLIDAMWAAPEWYRQRNLAEDFQHSIQQVIEIRRALDVLLGLPMVDQERLAFVGHDYGAMYGILAGGVDLRPKAYVFLAAAPSLSDWAFYANQPESKTEYLCQNAVLELTDYLHDINNASVFFQFAQNDIYISPMQARVLFRAANEPRQTKTYDADHSMDTDEIRADRQAFLKAALGLSVP
jgi:cephalosporin-C deacetylase-like acetyl esterase